MILGMSWLAAHNPEIDWKKGEVRMMRCPPMYGKRESDKRKWENRVKQKTTRRIEEVQNFVNEHLKKGYIRPSKSQQTSLVFFVGKKDREKHIVMDYH